MENEKIKQLVLILNELLQESSKLNFNIDINKLDNAKKIAFYNQLNAQKDIALAFIGKPTKKKHFKAIISIYEQYEEEVNKLIL